MKIEAHRPWSIGCKVCLPAELTPPPPITLPLSCSPLPASSFPHPLAVAATALYVGDFVLSWLQLQLQALLVCVLPSLSLSLPLSFCPPISPSLSACVCKRVKRIEKPNIPTQSYEILYVYSFYTKLLADEAATRGRPFLAFALSRLSCRLLPASLPLPSLLSLLLTYLCLPVPLSLQLLSLFAFVSVCLSLSVFIPLSLLKLVLMQHLT